MSALHLGSNAGCLRGREMRKGVKGRSHPELANCHHRPRGERRGRREGREDKADCSNTLTHIIISVWSVGWRKREGRLKPRSGTDGYTCPLSSSLPRCLVLSLSLSLAHLPSPGSLGLRLFISLSHVLFLSLSALWSSIPPGVSLSPSLFPTWVPPSSLTPPCLPAVEILS